ncbi:MAG TPA: transglutaminase-like domain-containing protein [Vicinamibacteria bacterium]|nr:transglutaminase-like domain-containing protein [Vicinamibacteria bacterium]
MEHRARFADLVSRPEAELDFAHAALLIAAEEYPDLDVASYISRLDALGDALSARLGAEPGPDDARDALNGLLYEEEGFHGNTKDYYDPRNSFLNDVLDRRTGIPITLSAVYIEVAGRAGIPVEGVSLPGHFIVRLRTPEGGMLVDPFHSGVRLSEEDCQKRLDRIYDGKMKLSPAMLASCGPRSMLARMLRNLKVIYVKRGDLQRAVAAVDLLLAASPDCHDERRDRGLLYAGLDCYAWAVRDLEGYLERVPQAKDAAAVQAKIADMTRKAARLN